MKNSKTLIITFGGLAVAMNIIFGIVTSMLKLPLYLDTLGTVFTAVLVGPLAGALVGTATNVITGLIYSPQDIPFFLVNVAVALVTGFAAKKYKFNFVTALCCGFILSVVAPLIGTPIGIFIYGGLTGTVSDVIVMALKNSGTSIFAASFIAKIGNNLIDKIGTCLIAYAVVQKLPGHLKYKLSNKNTSEGAIAG